MMRSRILTSMADIVKRFRLERVLMVVLAGILLVVTTACSPNDTKVSGDRLSGGSISGGRDYPGRTNPSAYPNQANNQSRPDINSFNDNDGRSDATVRARAKAMADQARRNVNQVQSPGELVDEIRQGTPIQERVRNLADDVGDTAGRVTKDFKENMIPD